MINVLHLNSVLMNWGQTGKGTRSVESAFWRHLMGRGAKCANSICGARSSGYDRAKWHKMVTAENLEAVRACLSADSDAWARQLSQTLTVGMRLCVSCWPEEAMQFIEPLLGADVMKVEDGELLSGRVLGLRVAGSWQRQRSQAGGTVLSEVLLNLGGQRILEVQFDGKDYTETMNRSECLAAITLRKAVDSLVKQAVETERKRVHNHLGKKHHALSAKLAQAQYSSGSVSTVVQATLPTAADLPRMTAMSSVPRSRMHEVVATRCEMSTQTDAPGEFDTFNIHNLSKEYFSRKRNLHLFKSLTGLDDWHMAEVFFNTWFADFSHERHGKLLPIQWFILSSWIMRHDISLLFLERFTGVSAGVLSRTLYAWACRMERRAAHSFIGVPDIQYLLDTVPQRHVDNGMENCVAFGDGVDVLTDRIRKHSRVGQMQQSTKLDDAAARAVALATGGGMVIGYTPMVLARATEGALMQSEEMQQVLRKIRPSGHIGYDKWETNLKAMCPNLNHCYVPTVVDGKAKGATLTGQTGNHSRGVAENRYSIEVVYRGAKTFRLLQGKVRRSRMRWINPTWVWALGFHNVVHQVLRPPHDKSTYWERHHPVHGHSESYWVRERNRRAGEKRRSKK